jgi:SAM-dependent methyltransferase
MNPATKLKYLLWAAQHWFGAERTCPSCGATATRLIKRKYAVTGLHRCDHCGLMFRVPKGTVAEDEQFYESEYKQESTTDLPDDVRLEALKKESFASIGKDYHRYIAILQVLGLSPGAIIYEFGSSWGYGSWQLLQQGYRVYSYELARTRSRFAQEKLGCYSLESPRDIPERADCFFAGHVLEHLPDPNLLWQIARDVLSPTGIVVLFTPNGEPIRERLVGRDYHHLWGRVHPLLLTAAAIGHMAHRHCYSGVAYSSPYDLGYIARGVPGRLDGEELLFIARASLNRDTS